MFRRLQIFRTPDFKVFFRRLDPTATDLGLVHSWVLRIGWLEIRRWNDDLLDILDAIAEDARSNPEKPLEVKPRNPGKDQLNDPDNRSD